MTDKRPVSGVGLAARQVLAEAENLQDLTKMGELLGAEIEAERLNRITQLSLTGADISSLMSSGNISHVLAVARNAHLEPVACAMLEERLVSGMLSRQKITLSEFMPFLKERARSGLLGVRQVERIWRDLESLYVADTDSYYQGQVRERAISVLARIPQATSSISPGDLFRRMLQIVERETCAHRAQDECWKAIGALGNAMKSDVSAELGAAFERFLPEGINGYFSLQQFSDDAVVAIVCGIRAEYWGEMSANWLEGIILRSAETDGLGGRAAYIEGLKRGDINTILNDKNGDVARQRVRNVAECLMSGASDAKTQSWVLSRAKGALHQALLACLKQSTSPTGAVDTACLPSSVR